ncbi:MAG: hypothetical protein D6741_09385 [Planctomycetota bacterium]|nr:MAG: hypothetical protein D6741_09385 [Planctomycetota bacterium]
MNLIGKIFVVLIFVMSLVFMSFAVAVYSAHTNWRDVVENAPGNVSPDKPLGLKYQLQDARKEVQELQAQLDKLTKRLQAEGDSMRQQLAKLQTERDELKRELDQRTAELATLTQQERDAVAAMKQAHDTLAARTAEVTDLRSKLQAAQQAQAEAFNTLVVRTDELHQTANELRLLKEKSATLAADFAKAKAVLEKFDLKPEPELYNEVAPRVDGVVVATPGNGLIEISIGADDGLIKGHRLEVYRMANGQSKYLGRVEVIRTTADRAVCQVLPEFSRGQMEEGDRVASKLN